MAVSTNYVYDHAIGNFARAGAIGVDQSNGDVYVIDVPKFVVKRYDADGNPKPFIADRPYVSGNELTGGQFQSFKWSGQPFAFEGGVSEATSQQVAIDSSGGTTDGFIYVTDYGNKIVQVFDSSGSFRGKIDGSAALPEKVGDAPCGVAVDPEGFLYIAYSGSIDKYRAVDGNPVHNVFVTNISGGGGCQIAVDSTGVLYETDTFIFEQGTAKHYGQPRRTIELFPGRSSGVAVNPVDDSVFLNFGLFTRRFDFLGNQVGSVFPAFFLPPPTNFFMEGSEGIAVDGSSGAVYATDKGLGRVRVFVPQGAPPSVSIQSADSITETSITLRGHVEPSAGQEITECFFVHGFDNSYGNVVPCQPAAPLSVSSDVSATVSGLSAGAKLHYRLVARSQSGTSNTPNQEVSTLSAPDVSGVGVKDLTPTSATLKALIDPRGLDTEYRFEYGPTSAYGVAAPVPNGMLSGLGGQLVSVDLADLTEGVTYHFRVVAENDLGTFVSDNQTFSFYPPNCPNAHVRQETNSGYLPDCRAYELVSPERSGGGSWFAAGPISPFATSPPRLAYAGVLADMPGGGNPINTLGDLYVSTRTSSGWVSKYLSLPSYEVSSMGSPPVPGINSIWGATKRGQLSGLLSNPSLSTIASWRQGNGMKVGSNGTIFDDGNRSDLPSNSPYVWQSDGTLVDRWPTNLHAVPGGDAVHLGDPDDYLDDWRGFQGAMSASSDMKHFFFSSRDTAYAPNGLTHAPGSVYDNDIENRTITIISKTPSGTDIDQESGWGDETPCDATSKPYTVFQDVSRACEWIRFPGTEMDGKVTDAVYGAGTTSNGSVSPDGSHVLMSTAVDGACVHYGNFYGARCPKLLLDRLYMRVNQSITYDVSRGHAVKYLGMVLDGSKVFFSTDEQMTVDDLDSGVDIFMWSEVTDSITRISGSGAVGNSDDCDAIWTDHCSAEVVDETATLYSAYPGGGNLETGSGSSDSVFASVTGDIYFTSPEKLDGDSGVRGNRNLYLFEDGLVRFVATFQPDGGVHRMQVTESNSFMAFTSGSRLTAYDNEGFIEMYRYNPTTGSIICVSCHPEGDPPVSDVRGSMNGLFIANDGRVFFATDDGLQTRDTNRVRDVYEYVDGRAQLLTPGTGSFVGLDGGNEYTLANPGLYGVSANGVDVYIVSYDKLVPQDQNGDEAKLYDVRTGGGFTFNPPPAPCAAADECHGVGSTEPVRPRIGTTAGLGATGNLRHVKPRKARRVRGKKNRKRHRRVRSVARGGRNG